VLEPPPLVADPNDTPVARSRIPALDAARALGVVAMVCGHTLDALLAPAVRAEPSMVFYWKARGLTAPLFLLVSGWAVSVAIARSGAQGAGVVRARLPRVVLLLLLGFALRWPGWDFAGLWDGDREVWRHFLAFDALHAIAVALLAAAAVFATLRGRGARAAAFGALTGLAIAGGLVVPRPSAFALPALALEQAFGGTSPFPVVPWVAYFFAGACVGLLVGDARGRRAAAMAAVGVALGALVFLDVGDMPPWHPVLIGFRVGAILLVLALLSFVPERAAKRLAPLGRASLAVYAIHVPIVYGWSTYRGLATRVGPTLPFATAVAAAAGVLAASWVLAGAWSATRAAAGRAWERCAVAAEALLTAVFGSAGAKDQDPG
jgi:acyltransferase